MGILYSRSLDPLGPQTLPHLELKRFCLYKGLLFRGRAAASTSQYGLLVVNVEMRDLIRNQIAGVLCFGKILK